MAIDLPVKVTIIALLLTFIENLIVIINKIFQALFE